MITALSLLIKALQSVGADGLCNGDGQCGCDLDDLAPCECLNLEHCQAAKFIKPKSGDADYWDEWPDGYYKAVEA